MELQEILIIKADNGYIVQAKYKAVDTGLFASVETRPSTMTVAVSGNDLLNQIQNLVEVGVS